MGMNNGVGLTTLLLRISIIELIKWRLRQEADTADPENEERVEEWTEKVSESTEQQEAVRWYSGAR